MSSQVDGKKKKHREPEHFPVTLGDKFANIFLEVKENAPKGPEKVTSQVETPIESETKSVGDRGARVIVYADKEGKTNTNIQEIDNSRKLSEFMEDVDHSNEVVIRTEVLCDSGVGRTKNFNNLKTSDEKPHKRLPKTHEISIPHNFYKEIQNGSKSFDLAKADQDIRRYDSIRYKEMDNTKNITGKSVLRNVGFTTKKHYSIREGFQVFSLLPVNPDKVVETAHE